MHIEAKQIEAITSRIPFTAREMKIAMEAVQTRRQKGTDLTLGDPADNRSEDAFAASLENGVMIMHSSAQLRKRFMFVKCNAGRSLFGRQKSVYASYLAELDADDWMVGPVFKMWPIAVTSIGNIYRAEGYR